MTPDIFRPTPDIEFDLHDDYIKATNITSFINVADAMISEGY